MLYRPGTMLQGWHGHDLDHLIVASAEEEAAARNEGWMRDPIPHPLDHDGDGRKGGSRPRITKERLTNGQ